MCLIIFVTNLIRKSNCNDQMPIFSSSPCTLRKYNYLASLALHFLFCKQGVWILSGCFQFCEGERSNSLHMKGFLFHAVRFLSLLNFSWVLPVLLFLLFHCICLITTQQKWKKISMYASWWKDTSQAVIQLLTAYSQRNHFTWRHKMLCSVWVYRPVIFISSEEFCISWKSCYNLFYSSKMKTWVVFTWKLCD